MQVTLIYKIALVLLLINGFSACFGGISLILDPSGEFLGLSLHKLVFLPFKSYLVPGILLLIFNGISSLYIAFLMMRKVKYHSIFVVLQGIILIVWIITESFALPNDLLQYPYVIIGIALILTGFIMYKRQEVGNHDKYHTS